MDHVQNIQWLQKKVVQNSWYTYICESWPWIATSVAQWRIYRITDATSDLYFPLNWLKVDNWFSFKADDVLTLTYSYS